MLDEFTAGCPYCGEDFVTTLDFSAGAQSYIEDCQICCRPIVFNLLLDPVTGESDVILRRDDD